MQPVDSYGEMEENPKLGDSDWSRPPHDHCFSPLFFIFQWSESETLTKRVTVAINLPPGVEMGGFTVRALIGGGSLELTVSWPGQRVDMKAMHKKWLLNLSIKFEMYHPELKRIYESLKKHRAKAFDWRTSKAVISLPCQVQIHTSEKHNLG